VCAEMCKVLEVKRASVTSVCFVNTILVAREYVPIFKTIPI